MSSPLRNTNPLLSWLTDLVAFYLIAPLDSSGVHWLQDPRSRAYNFTPWLEVIHKVNDFTVERVTGFPSSPTAPASVADSPFTSDITRDTNRTISPASTTPILHMRTSLKADCALHQSQAPSEIMTASHLSHCTKIRDQRKRSTCKFSGSALPLNVMRTVTARPLASEKEVVILVMWTEPTSRSLPSYQKMEPQTGVRKTAQLHLAPQAILVGIPIPDFQRARGQGEDQERMEEEVNERSELRVGVLPGVG
ncbi:hypothetical protein EDC04DRAFT_2610448 [Pisolithus marmoratus]|nr:hypothetical protein EDC04DRAFT_2610448 [Pisolithus marmoratus]